MILTDRDYFIFRKLGRYHLTASMLAALSQTYRNRVGERQPFTTLQGVSRRLKQLADARLVTFQPLRCFHNTHCYRLTRKGAKLILTPEQYHREKHSKALFSGFSVQKEAHTLTTSLVAVKLEIDADRAGISLPLFVRDGDFTATVELDDKKRKLIPDGTVVLTGRGDPQLFFIEIDRSTELLSTFAEKVRKYLAFDERHPTILLKDNGQHYPCSSFRVLTFCKSDERLQNLVHITAKTARSRKHRVFHFFTLDHILNEDGLQARNSLSEASILTETGFTTPKGLSRLYGQL